ncbi:MAG TPA: hypothetical protein VEL07_11700 [Planctomycetota bacterium]|nr:hypothetical protein [Planctomycetota bacterium]
MNSTAGRRPGRRGTVLIIVSGIVALLAALSFSFLARMRSDVEETNGIVAEAQARIMLLAACDYILEASRLGYGTAPSSPAAAPPGDKHREAYGWLDVRDGSTGPRGDDPGWPAFFSLSLVEDGDGDGDPDRRAWPAVKSVARCPMHVLQRPPFATRITAVYNPISTTAGAPDRGFPYLRNPDPQPQVTNGYPTVSDAIAIPSAGGASNWSLYIHGDTQARIESVGRSWFRVYRDQDATFVVTCGAGASQGYKDWGEVVGAGEQGAFGTRQAFDQIVGAEVRLWYRVQWSAATLTPEYDNICAGLKTPNGSPYGNWDGFGSPDPNARDTYMMSPPNASSTWALNRCRTQAWNKNLVGTIHWVQRLSGAPTHW